MHNFNSISVITEITLSLLCLNLGDFLAFLHFSTSLLRTFTVVPDGSHCRQNSKIMLCGYFSLFLLS